MIKKFFKVLMTMILVLAMAVPIFAEGIPLEVLSKDLQMKTWLYNLTDVSDDDWFAPILPGVYDIMKGVSDTEFAPNQPMTRAMFATVLYRMSGESVEGSALIFKDVPQGEWYTDAVNWAAENSIVNGFGENRFEPDSNITKEQIAVMLKKYSDYKKCTLVIRDTNLSNYSSFSDANSVSSWAEEAMKWAVKYGIIKGSDIGLEPQKTATRAEVAQLMYNFIMCK